jgi:hypothetical protein
MGRVLLVLLVLPFVVGGGVATAQKRTLSAIPGDRPEDLKPIRADRLKPIPFFWQEIDLQRQNEGLAGRKNATRDEQRVAETPSLQPRPLSSY